MAKAPLPRKECLALARGGATLKDPDDVAGVGRDAPWERGRAFGELRPLDADARPVLGPIEMVME